MALHSTPRIVVTWLKKNTTLESSSLQCLFRGNSTYLSSFPMNSISVTIRKHSSLSLPSLFTVGTRHPPIWGEHPVYTPSKKNNQWKDSPQPSITNQRGGLAGLEGPDHHGGMKQNQIWRLTWPTVCWRSTFFWSRAASNLSRNNRVPDIKYWCGRLIEMPSSLGRPCCVQSSKTVIVVSEEAHEQQTPSS